MKERPSWTREYLKKRVHVEIAEALPREGPGRPDSSVAFLGDFAVPFEVSRVGFSRGAA